MISVYGIILTFLSFRFVSAFFTDSANSNDNTFTAAAEFPTASPSGTIVISEVQTNGGTGGGQDQLTDRDFIELYNVTAVPINLNGYRLVKRTGSGVPTDTTIIAFNATHEIPAHGYFLWASSESPGFAASISANVTTSQTLATPNNSIALRNGPVDTGTIIDALSWSSTANSLVEGAKFTPDLDASQSMERKALSASTVLSMGIGGVDEFKGNGLDSGNNATDFILRTTSQPQNKNSATEAP